MPLLSWQTLVLLEARHGQSRSFGEWTSAVANNVTVKGKSVYARENRMFPFMIVMVTFVESTEVVSPVCVRASSVSCVSRAICDSARPLQCSEGPKILSADGSQAAYIGGGCNLRAFRELGRSFA
jgi:hypothetical protein